MLPEAYKNAYTEALAEAREVGVASYQNNMKEMRGLMEEAGMEMREMPAEVVEHLKSAAQASYDLLAEDVGPEYLDGLRAALETEAAK